MTLSVCSTLDMLYTHRPNAGKNLIWCLRGDNHESASSLTAQGASIPFANDDERELWLRLLDVGGPPRIINPSCYTDSLMSASTLRPKTEAPAIP